MNWDNRALLDEDHVTCKGKMIINVPTSCAGARFETDLSSISLLLCSSFSLAAISRFKASLSRWRFLFSSALRAWKKIVMVEVAGSNLLFHVVKKKTDSVPEVKVQIENQNTQFEQFCSELVRSLLLSSLVWMVDVPGLNPAFQAVKWRKQCSVLKSSNREMIVKC